ncbi:MAG: hypothetical protein RSF35_09595 [Akkermansia sp.]
MDRFNDIAWLTSSENEDLIAYIACAFHNYKRLIDRVKQGCPLGVVSHGKRKALVRLDADSHWLGIVERHLAGRL